MSAAGRFQASGCRGREVEIPRPAGKQGPVILEFKGGLSTTFQVDALRRSTTRKDDGGSVLRVYGSQPHRGLLPAGYNRVKITRVKPKPSTGTGFSRWRLRTVEAAELPVLTDTMSGKHQGFLYFDGHASVSFAWLGDTESGELHFTPAAGGKAESLTRRGDIRGVVTVPGSGFLAVSTWGRWTLERR